MTKACVIMSSKEKEPESQFNITIHEHMNEKDPPSVFIRQAHAYREQVPALNDDEPGSDDTIPEFKSSSPRPPNDELKSQVEETQYVTLELDTQPRTEFDFSPTTRRVLDNAEPSSAKLPTLAVDALLLQRQEIPHIDVSEFRYGPPPKKNLNLTRPNKPPRRDQEADIDETQNPARRSLHANMTSLPSRGGPPRATFTSEKAKDAPPPATQKRIMCSLEDGETNAKQSHDAAEPRYHSETPVDCSVEQNRSGEPSLRLPATSKPPFDDAILTSKANAEAHRLNKPKTKSVPEQRPEPQNRPRRPAKLMSPPFAEEILNRGGRARSSETSAIATIPDCLPAAAAGHDAVKSVKAKANSTATLLLPEPVEDNDTQERVISEENQDITTHEFQGVGAQEKFDDTDITSNASCDSDLRGLRPPLHNLPTNHRQKSRNRGDANIALWNGGTKVPTSRPLSGHQVQPQDMGKSQILHGTRDSGVSKRAPSKLKNAATTQANVQLQDGGSKTITSVEMMQMAAIMANKENHERDAFLARIRLQELQITELSDTKAVLQEQIILLEEENGKLSKKQEKFQERCDKYREHMNDVISAQKDLMAAARSLDKKKMEFVRQSAIKMDAELSKTKASLSVKSREILREAREKIDSQERLVELLNRDLENRLLELQRERGLTERLQKQLEDRERQQEEIKLMLLNQERKMATALAGHEDIMLDILSAGADRGMRFDECLALIKTIKESAQESLPALNEVSQLVVKLSASIQNKLQEAEYGSIHVREAGVEALAELKNRLRMLSEDQATQQGLIESITQLREENATLKERIQSRDSEFIVVGDQLEKLKLDLQACRSQLASTADNLSNALAAPREDPVLRVQLLDLQASYSTLRDQAETYRKEMEIVRDDLRRQKESNKLGQEEIKKLQELGQQSQAKISAFEVQRETYVRQVREESNELRVEMERDIRARLAEDEAHHSGVVAGLRRQVIEAEAKLVRMEKELHDMEQTGAVASFEAHELSEAVLVLEERINIQSTSLSCVQKKLREMEEARGLAARELYEYREQLSQYEKEAAEWMARAEESALLFAKQCGKTDEEAKKFDGQTEIELNTLKAEVNELQKKIEDSVILEVNLGRWLRDRELLKTGMTLTEWVTQLSEDLTEPEKSHLNPVRQVEIKEPFPEVFSLSQQSFAGGTQTNYGGSALRSKKKHPQITLPKDLAFAQSVGESLPDTAIPSCESLAKDTGDRLQEGNVLFRREKAIFDSVSSDRRIIKQSPERQSIMNESPPECSGKRITPAKLTHPFPATAAIPKSYPKTGDHIGNSITNLDGAKLLNDMAGTIILDSQDDSIQEHTQNLIHPPRRVAQRRNSIAIQPNLRESNRTISGNEVPESNIVTSEFYGKSPTVQQEIRVAAPSCHPAIELNSLELDDDSSSSLTDPPSDSDLELMEFDYTWKGQKLCLKNSGKGPKADNTAPHPVPSPKPNTSRVRTTPSLEAVNPGEMRPPKSILKRTNSDIHSIETVSNLHSSIVTTRSSELSKVHSGTAPRKRLSRPKIGSKRLDSALYNSPYNRIVSGTKASNKGYDISAATVPSQGPPTPVADIFAVASSPAIGQPLRNSKKRVLSRIGIDDNLRQAKLPRLGKY